MISLCDARQSYASNCSLGSTTHHDHSPSRDHLRKITLAAHHSYAVSHVSQNDLSRRKKRKLMTDEASLPLPLLLSSESESGLRWNRCASQISLDFLSGIFQDLNSDPMSVEAEGGPSPSLSPSFESKRVRVDEGSYDHSDGPCVSTVSSSVSTATSNSRISRNSNSSRSLPKNALAAEIVDTVFASHSIPMFPELPHTISSSSCSSNNLTLTSVPAAQVLEASLPQSPLDLEQHEENYGFYVDIDNDDTLHQRLECVSKAAETCRRSLLGLQQDLAFAPSAQSPFKDDLLDGSLDSETAWAKAADTVDDVLGDLF